jgi:hypothetical protein
MQCRSAAFVNKQPVLDNVCTYVCMGSDWVSWELSPSVWRHTHHTHPLQHTSEPTVPRPKMSTRVWFVSIRGWGYNDRDTRRSDCLVSGSADYTDDPLPLRCRSQQHGHKTHTWWNPPCSCACLAIALAGVNVSVDWRRKLPWAALCLGVAGPTVARSSVAASCSPGAPDSAPDPSLNTRRMCSTPPLASLPSLLAAPSSPAICCVSSLANSRWLLRADMLRRFSWGWWEFDPPGVPRREDAPDSAAETVMPEWRRC